MKASNLQELKDAAAELMRFTCNSCERRFCEEDIEEEDGRSAPSPCSAIIRMRNALSANPIRNCDVGTADEQIARFNEFCDSEWQDSGSANCGNCPLWVSGRIGHDCQIRWEQRPYEAQGGGAK